MGFIIEKFLLAKIMLHTLEINGIETLEEKKCLLKNNIEKFTNIVDLIYKRGMSANEYS